MSNATRRSFLKGSLVPLAQPQIAAGPDAASAGPALDRRAFLQASAGAAAGAAVIVGGPRLDAVLSVLYLVFNEGYLATSHRQLVRGDVVDDALGLARSLSALLPHEPQPMGLLALMVLHDSRRDARVSDDGESLGPCVHVEIRDHGVGIPAKDLERIFERFYRVDRARSRDVGGTGLGLSIVKHLVQEFGGGIEIRSQAGQGTTFAVRLPRAE